jgi:hypothetical protein
VVVWQDGTLSGGGGAGRGVFGQRYDGSGVPLGPEFQVETYTTGFQGFPSVGADANGDFVVVWSSDGQDGSDLGVFGQRYASSGVPLDSEFRVNTHTTDAQTNASVAAIGGGTFVVAWQSQGQDGSAYGVYSQRYSAIVPVELMQFGVE